MELIDFQDKKWRVVGRVEGNRIDDHTQLKEQWGCDLVLKDKNNMFFMLDKVIDAEFTEL